MGIINPVMLFFSLGALLIAFMYFIKNKYANYIVPSISLWDKVINEESNISKFEKFKNRLIMYIQILILILIILMLSGLYIKGEDQVSGNTLLFVDNSIMMNYSKGEKTNLEKAKLEMIKIIEKSSDNATFTIVDSNGNSTIVVDKKAGKKAVNSLYQLNTRLKSRIINNIISGFRSSNEDAYVIVFSNSMQVDGDKNYRYESMKNNLAITKIDVYEENYNIEITNYNLYDVNTELLIKLDNETIDIFDVNIRANESKVISYSLDKDGEILTAKIDVEDDIAIDNYASKTIKRDEKISVFLSSESSNYIRDALRLNNKLLISESIEAKILNDGFDIYVYDGVEPDKLPKTGSMLLINPPRTSKFVSGLVQNEMYIKLSLDDVNSFVEPFYVASSKELSTKTLKTIGSIDGKAIIQKGSIGELNTFVMGFDILDTNLPLKYSFPVYIQNIIQYFTSDEGEDDVYIVSDKIDIGLDFSEKEDVRVSRQGESILQINLKWILALLTFAFLTIEMEVFKREY